MTMQKFIHIYNSIENIIIFVCSLQFWIMTERKLDRNMQSGEKYCLGIWKLIVDSEYIVKKGTVRLKKSVFQESIKMECKKFVNDCADDEEQ